MKEILRVGRWTVKAGQFSPWKWAFEKFCGDWWFSVGPFEICFLRDVCDA